MSVLFLVLSLTLVALARCEITNWNYSEPYSGTVKSEQDHILLFSGQKIESPIRIMISSTNATSQAPLFVSTLQSKSLSSSWEVPVPIVSKSGSYYYWNTTNTLCYVVPQNTVVTGVDQDLKVIISSESTSDVDFLLQADIQTEFKLNHSVEYSFTISPSQPIYFFYNFSVNLTQENLMEYNFDIVLLDIKSSDTICAEIHVENASCPFFDFTAPNGFYQTFDTKGGLTIKKSDFPDGFYAAFVAKADDFECTGKLSEQNFIKDLTISIKPTISYDTYMHAVGWIMGILILVHIYVMAISCIIFERNRNQTGHPEYEPINAPPEVGNQPINYGTNQAGANVGPPHVADLNTKGTDISTTSYSYLYYVLIVVAFYGLPMLQATLRYEKKFKETGNLDTCYYNFLCAHPFGLLNDFNHVISNDVYVLLGLLLAIIIYGKFRDMPGDRGYGVLKHIGVYYAMAAALVLQGTLSAVYHVCPNKADIPFDFTMMYLMSAFCIVNLYQKRGFGQRFAAHLVFGLVAVVIFLGVIDLWINKFIIATIILHLLLVIYICYKIWNYLRMTRLLMILNNYYYKVKLCMLLIFFVCNCAVIPCVITYKFSSTGLYVMLTLMCNATLYLIYYVFMKHCYQERISVATWTMLILSIVLNFSAVYCLLQHPIYWSSTQAEARRAADECILFKFYDYHDLWHLLSALGMFFMFVGIMKIDDNLKNVHQTRIPVF